MFFFCFFYYYFIRVSIVGMKLFILFLVGWFLVGKGSSDELFIGLYGMLLCSSWRWGDNFMLLFRCGCFVV